MWIIIIEEISEKTDLIVGIPIGTNCAPLVTDLFVFVICYSFCGSLILFYVLLYITLCPF